MSVLKRAGLSPQMEPFRGSTSAWLPYSVGTGTLLFSLALSLAGFLQAAALLALLAAFSLFLELSFTPGPLRLLPGVSSQNVVARLAPTERTEKKVVLAAHLDTHRTPGAFSSQRALSIYRCLVTLGMAGAVLLTSLVVAAAAMGRRTPAFVAIVPALPLLPVLALCIQADLTPHTPGANDNASGVGVVLFLAEALARAPLRRTEVWFLLTGCEEVGARGAEAFVRNHRKELDRPFFIAVDSVGGKGTHPTFLAKETLFLPFRSNSFLFGLAQRAARERPELGAREWKNFRGAYTDAAPAARAGWPVLGLVNLTPQGVLPQWHRLGDVFDKLDPSAVERTGEFLLSLLRSLDGASP